MGKQSPSPGCQLGGGTIMAAPPESLCHRGCCSQYAGTLCSQQQSPECIEPAPQQVRLAQLLPTALYSPAFSTTPPQCSAKGIELPTYASVWKSPLYEAPTTLCFVAVTQNLAGQWHLCLECTLECPHENLHTIGSVLNQWNRDGHRLKRGVLESPF